MTHGHTTHTGLSYVSVRTLILIFVLPLWRSESLTLRTDNKQQCFDSAATSKVYHRPTIIISHKKTSGHVPYCHKNGPQFVITARTELRKVLFLALSLTFCVWNISETAERICTKFTRKTHVWRLAGMSLNANCQRSRSPGTKRHFSALSAAWTELK